MSFSEKSIIVDKATGLTAQIAGTGALFAAELEPQINAVFLNPLLTFQWITTTANGGTVPTTGGVVLLQNNGTANGACTLTSNKKARYYGAQPNRYIAAVVVGDTGGVNNIRRWGAFDANNGYFFQLSGTVLSIVSRKDAVDTVVIQSSWSNPTGFTLDTNFHTYVMDYTASNVQVVIDGVKVHSLSPFTATALVNGPTAPLRFENTNSGGSTTNHTVGCRGLAIQRHGSAASRPQFLYVNATSAGTNIKNGPGTLRRIVNNNNGTGGASLTLYDNTTAAGTIIAIIDIVNILGAVTYDVDFDNGLTYVTTGANISVTLVYD